MNFEDIIKHIPEVLEYFVPGYIVASLFRVLMDNENDSDAPEKIVIVRCICISFVLRMVFLAIESLLFRIALEILLGCTLVIFFVRLISIRKIRHLYSLINHTTISKTVFEAIGMVSKDQFVSIYLKDGSMVYGRFVVSGSYTKDPWISVDNYRTSGISFDIGDGKKRDEWNDEKEKSTNRILSIAYSDIKMISLRRTQTQKELNPVQFVVLFSIFIITLCLSLIALFAIKPYQQIGYILIFIALIELMDIIIGIIRKQRSKVRRKAKYKYDDMRKKLTELLNNRMLSQEEFNILNAKLK